MGKGRCALSSKRRRAACRLDGIVRFTGHRDECRSSWPLPILVLPSLYQGLPNIVLEAMQSALPVVATAAPGTTEVVVDGQTGLVPAPRAPRTRAGDPDVVEDPEPRPSLGRRRKSTRRVRFRAGKQSTPTLAL